MDDDLSAAQPRAPLGSARSWQLRLVRAANLTIATDPALADLYRTRFEGAPPKVRVRGGVVAVEYGPRFRPANWGRQAAELTLNPSVGWRIEAPKGLEGLRADLRAIQLLGLEVQHATSKAEVTLARPVGTVLLRFGGASEVTIHRPTGTAARVQVTGGASRVSFDDQFYKAVGGEASWTTSDFEQATDRYDIDFSRGCAIWWSTPSRSRSPGGPSGCWPRCCSPTSSGPPNEPGRSATSGGGSCSTSTTRQPGGWSTRRAGG